MTDQKQVGRLAFRVEGDMWNAYYALPTTMDGALFLGSIRMVFVHDADRKAAFMDMMRQAVSEILKGETGFSPIWPGPVVAPEHERGGKA